MKFVYGLLGLFAIAIIAIVAVSNSDQPGDLDGFARCLDTKGFKFYGAYWCPHCIDQKEIFGNSGDELPYVECSLPQRGGQTAECTNAGIVSYPTWVLPSGKKIEGVISVQELASLSGCSVNMTA